MREKIKILVVDDDQRMVRTICDILRVKGYEPLAVNSGEEAVERVKTEVPHCVLMDIKMGGISGVKALEMIQEISPNVPVVLMTAYSTEELVQESKAKGAHAVLIKPIDFQQVLSFISLLEKEESILIVDDDHNFCKTLKDLLLLRGYKIDTECEGKQVFSHLEGDEEKIVLLDLKLGNTNGIEVLKDVRSKRPSIPVVLVTGHRQEMAASIEKGLSIGAYSCLYKPFEIGELVETIEEIRRNKFKKLLET